MPVSPVCSLQLDPREDRYSLPLNADPNFDPVAAARNERKARSLKNEGQRLQNLQRAAQQAAKQTQDSTAKNAQRDQRKREVEQVLKATKKSTASLGKFDDKLKGEGREKHVKRKVGHTLSTSAQVFSLSDG